MNNNELIVDYKRLRDMYRKDIKAKNRRISMIEKDNKQLRIMCQKLSCRVLDFTEKTNKTIMEQQLFIAKQQKILFGHELNIRNKTEKT